MKTVTHSSQVFVTWSIQSVLPLILKTFKDAQLFPLKKYIESDLQQESHNMLFLFDLLYQ